MGSIKIIFFFKKELAMYSDILMKESRTSRTVKISQINGNEH